MGVRVASWLGLCIVFGACTTTFPDFPEGSSSSAPSTTTDASSSSGMACANDWETDCGGTCVDTATDVMHCYQCDVACDTTKGEICETGGSPNPVCANVSWARWPMPNGPTDVANGAPHPLSYNDNGDGTVTDLVTGLMWQETPPFTGGQADDGRFTQAEAVDYCRSTLSAAALGGHHDWRLPSRIEMISIIDYSLVSPAIDTSYFAEVSGGDAYWTADLHNVSGYGWFVFTYDGESDDDLSTNAHRARCVR
jgi:Protein of unknown function (DUF1566)